MKMDSSGKRKKNQLLSKDPIDYLKGLTVWKYCVQRYLESYCIVWKNLAVSSKNTKKMKK